MNGIPDKYNFDNIIDPYRMIGNKNSTKQQCCFMYYLEDEYE